MNVPAAGRSCEKRCRNRYKKAVQGLAVETVTVAACEEDAPFTYEGEALRALAFPLGGIGTGHFCICGDGGFRQWQIFNQVNHLAYLPGTFLAIRVWRAGSESKAFVLQSSALYSEEGFEPAPLVTDHILPDQAKHLMETLPGVTSIRVVGQYPVARFEYKDENLPLDVELKAFSPLVPLDQKNSGLPVVFLALRLRNPGTDQVEASCLASLQNAVGWDGATPISGTSCPLYGGNVNSLVMTKGATILVMGNNSIEEGSARKGEMALALLGDGASVRPQWDDLHGLWEDFRSDGRLVRDSLGPSPAGRTWNGALAKSLVIKPGECREVVFVIAWHFPNRYVNWNQKGLGLADDKTRFWLGTMYSNWFAGVLETINYAVDSYGDLVFKTERFWDCLFDTTLPGPVLDAASSQISTIRSPTCFWTQDGRFYGFEGCCGASTGCSSMTGGCCPLNCTHVWNYEQTLSRLFPELERTMREVDLAWQLGEDGRIPHRTLLPLYLPRWRERDPTSHVYAVDGHCGTILKTYREYRACGDPAFLERYWPALKKALEYAIRTWDPDLDGVLDGPQWNTYDCHLHGHNSFTTGLYLAALRAMEEMAKLRKEPDVASRCRGLYAKGRSIIESELWNGEYYMQRYDRSKHGSMQYGEGCHSDQLLGQWWAHILGLGHLLPPGHVRRALESIFRYNMRSDLVGHIQKPRVYLKEGEAGLLICTWPMGGRPDPVTLYSDEVWTGIEYSVAGLMVYEGMIEETLIIVEKARQRHDGRCRSPWNEVECGDHYVRPMSSWALFEALCGFVYDAGRRRIAFDPKASKEDFRCFFATERGWGRYSQKVEGNRQVCEISLIHGSLEVDTMSFPQLLKGNVAVTLYVDDARLADAQVRLTKAGVVIRGSIRLAEAGSAKAILERT